MCPHGWDVGIGWCAETHKTKTETKPSTEQAARTDQSPPATATRQPEEQRRLFLWGGPFLVRWSPSVCGLGVLAGWLRTAVHFPIKWFQLDPYLTLQVSSPNKSNSYLDPSPHIPKAETAKPNVMGLALARNYFYPIAISPKLITRVGLFTLRCEWGPSMRFGDHVRSGNPSIVINNI